MLLTMTDVGVRVIEMKDRSRRRNLPTVLGQQVKERAWPVRHLDFRLSEGEAVCILDIANDRPGLFLRLATGLLGPDEGTVDLPKRSIMAAAPKRRTLRSLSVEQVIRLTAGMYGLSDKMIDRRFDEMVEFAELGRLLHKSGDSQPRHVIAQAAFAAATCSPADLVAFDHDAVVGSKEFRQKCFQRLAEMKAAGKGLVVFTQDPRQIRQVADRGLVLDGAKNREMAVPAFAQLVVDHKKGRLVEKRRRKKRRERDEDEE